MARGMTIERITMTGTSLLRLLLLLVLLCAESIVLGLTHNRHTSDGGGGDPDGADGKYTAVLRYIYCMMSRRWGAWPHAKNKVDDDERTV